MKYRLFAALAALALAAAFARPAAADDDCKVCLYEDIGFRGASHCVDPITTSIPAGPGISDRTPIVTKSDKYSPNLKEEGFNDKISSVKLAKKACPDLAVVLYDNDNYGGKIVVLTESATSIGSGLNDKVTSFQAFRRGLGTPEASHSCGICLFDHPGYFGRYKCSDGNRSTLKNSNSAIDFDNDAESLKLYKDETCPNLAAELYEHQDYKGKTLQFTADAVALGNLVGKVSSLKVFKDGIADPKDCGICLYENSGFKGAEYCSAVDESDLRKKSFNDKASSIRLYKKSCPNLAVKVWDNDGFKGDSFKVLNANASSLGGKLNDKVTSFNIFRNGTSGPWKETNGCGACLFQHEGYSGSWACTTATIGDLGETDVKRDKASSLWIDKKTCPKAEVVLAADRNIGGATLTLSGSVADLSNKEFNDKAKSMAFKETANSAVTDLDCGVCLYENTRFGGAWYCDGGDAEIPNLKDKGFNDKAQSVKLIKTACPALEVVLYEDDGYKGKRVVVTENGNTIGSGLGDKVTSLRAFSRGAGTPSDAPDCGVCLFDQGSYFGNSECSTFNRNTLKGDRHPFNDKARSVKLYKKTCPDLGVVLYEHEEYLGKKLQLAADAMALGDLSGKVSSLQVVPEGLPDPKKCGICLYEDYSFKGSEYCTAVNESNLSTQDFNDKTSSIRLYNKTCPKLSITVYDKKDYVAQYGTKVRFIGDSIGKIPDSLNDRISSITLHPEGENDTDPVKLTGGCGACVYEDDGFVGRHLCLKDDELREEIDTSGQVRIPNQTAILENDKVSSVWVERSTCPKGKAVLYEDKGFAGKSLALEESVNDLKNKNFNDKVSSFRFSKSGGTASPNATNGCGICLYEDTSFKGAKKCFDRDVTNLKDYDFNDKASSVKLDKKKCPKLAVKLWDGHDFAVYDPPYDPAYDFGKASPDKFRLINADVRFVGRKLNDRISSFKIYPNGYKDPYGHSTAPWTLTNGCGTCLFWHEDYSGPWTCTTGSIADLGDESAETWIGRDKATSVWIDNKKCPDAEAALYKDIGLKGNKLVLSGSVADLSDKDYNDKADSVVFSRTAFTGTTGTPACGICLYENVGFGGASACFTPGADGTTKVLDLRHNNDKASSAKLFKDTCPSLQAILYKDKEFKGPKLTLTGDDRDLGQLKGEVSSLRLGSGQAGGTSGQTGPISGKNKAK